MSAHLSEQEQAKAEKYARDWLGEHRDFYQLPAEIVAYDYDARLRDARGQRQMGIGSATFWILAMIAGALYLGREQFQRDWDAGRFPGWVREGLRRLLRKVRPPWPGSRALAIMAIGVVALWIMVRAGMHGTARVFRFLLLGGAILVYSGLSLSEDAEGT